MKAGFRSDIKQVVPDRKFPRNLKSLMTRSETPCTLEARREATQNALAGSRGEAPGIFF